LLVKNRTFGEKKFLSKNQDGVDQQPKLRNKFKYGLKMQILAKNKTFDEK